MNNIIAKILVSLSFISFLCVASPLTSCNKMEQREDAEDNQIENFKKSIAQDTLNVYARRRHEAG